MNVPVEKCSWVQMGSLSRRPKSLEITLKNTVSSIVRRNSKRQVLPVSTMIITRFVNQEMARIGYQFYRIFELISCQSDPNLRWAENSVAAKQTAILTNSRQMLENATFSSSNAKTRKTPATLNRLRTFSISAKSRTKNQSKTPFPNSSIEGLERPEPTSGLD